MRHSSSNQLLWKIFVLAVALIAIVQMLFIYRGMDISRSTNTVGTLGAALKLEQVLGSSRERVAALNSDSPLAAAGAAVGDLVMFDRIRDRQGTLEAGEVVGLTLYHDGVARHLNLQTVPGPNRFSNALEMMAVFTTLASLSMAVVIGLQQADQRAMRWLTVFFLSFTIGQHLGFPGESYLLSQFPWAMSFPALFAGLVIFAVTYQSEHASPRRRAMARAIPAYLVLTVLVAVFYVFSMVYYVPGREAFGIVYAALNSAVILIALWDAWFHSEGASRTRQLWILVLFGFRAIVMAVAWFRPLYPAAIADWIPWFQRVGALAFIVGLAYAIFRIRLLSIGFAINRALVYTLFSTLLLIIFSVTEWGVDKLLHFEGRQKNVIFDAAVALAIILCFHRIQHTVRHRIDHMFFHKWYEKAEALKQFIAKLSHYSEPIALQQRYLDAACAFSDASGAAIYLAMPHGAFVRQHSNFSSAPDAIAPDHDLVIELRHKRAAVEIAPFAMAGDLALPMTVRGKLIGIVLMDAKANGEHHRPDEVALLTQSVQALAVEVENLRTEQLQQQNQELRQQLQDARVLASSLERQSLAQQGEATALRTLLAGSVGQA
jgi:hypothetical protein